MGCAGGDVLPLAFVTRRLEGEERVSGRVARPRKRPMGGWALEPDGVAEEKRLRWRPLAAGLGGVSVHGASVSVHVRRVGGSAAGGSPHRRPTSQADNSRQTVGKIQVKKTTAAAIPVARRPASVPACHLQLRATRQPLRPPQPRRRPSPPCVSSYRRAAPAAASAAAGSAAAAVAAVAITTGRRLGSSLSSDGSCHRQTRTADGVAHLAGAVVPPALQRLHRLERGRRRGPLRTVGVATSQPLRVVARTTHILCGAVARAVLPKTIAVSLFPIHIGAVGRHTTRFDCLSRRHAVVFRCFALIVGVHPQVSVRARHQRRPAAPCHTMNRTVVVRRLGRCQHLTYRRHSKVVRLYSPATDGTVVQRRLRRQHI